MNGLGHWSVGACGAFILQCGGDLNAGWNEPSTRSATPAVTATMPERLPAEPRPVLDAGTPNPEPDDAGAPAPAAAPSSAPEAGAPAGLLPVGNRNPILLWNDGSSDNWQGELSVLFSATTGPTLVGIAVGTSVNWPDVDANLADWQALVDAARASGLGNVPDPIGSSGDVLVRPGDGVVEATVPNQSAGARLILDASSEHATTELPLVVVSGSRLTDIADAYLMDPTVVERVVVVASLGSVDDGGGTMGIPNGEMDPWADVIVARNFRYIQVSDHYDQLQDVPEALVPQLPANPFGEWVARKRLGIWSTPQAADQVGVLAVAMPGFVLQVKSVARPDTTAGIPTLSDDPSGPVTLVSEIDGPAASARFQQLLLDPSTFVAP